MSAPNVEPAVFRGNLALAVGVALIGALAVLALARPLLEHPPEYDELLHVLAARGVDATGTPAIADGSYARAPLYTRLVAAFNDGPDELVGARLPALAAGAALVALIGAWVTWKAGWLAGLCAAMVLAIFPIVVHSAVLVRFYTLHALLMCAFLILVHELSDRRRWRRVRPATLAGLALLVPLLVIGWKLHELTLIAVGAGLCGLAAVLVWDGRGPLLRVARARPATFLLTLLALAAVAGFVAHRVDVIGQLRGGAAAWSAARADYAGFYVGALGFQMPFFWPTFPLLAAAALFGRPRLAIFCLAVLGSGLVANSIAAQKATRYVLQLLPFLCALWGIGLQTLLGGVARTLAAADVRRTAPIALALLALVGVSVASTHEFKRSLKLLLGRGVTDGTIPVLDEPDWSLAAGTLRPWLDAGDELIVSSGVKGLYYFDRYDFELSGSVVEETDTGVEFGRDPRTGKHVISTVPSVTRVVESEGVELFVLEDRKLGVDYGTRTDVVAALDARCRREALPPASRLSAWRCL